MEQKLKAILLAFALAVSAEASIWGQWIAGGTSCNPSNVSVIENGSSLSVLFDAFGVNMPVREFGEGLSVRKTCNFRITVTPPNGFYLAGFRQTYSGGLIKSRASSAQLNIRYNIGSVGGVPLPIIWPRGVEVRPEDPGSLFAKTYHNSLLVGDCGASTIYGINMNFTATRSSVGSDFLVGGLDTVDADFVQKVILIPEWRLCP